MIAARRAAAFLFAAAAFLFAAAAFTAAQAAALDPVCPKPAGNPDPPGNPDTPNPRVECKKNASSTDDIDIRLEDYDITVSDNGMEGVYAQHLGTGDIDIRIDRGTIETRGAKAGFDFAEGVYAQHTGAGDLAIRIDGSTVLTSGRTAVGVKAQHSGDGRLAITLDGAHVETEDDYSIAVQGSHSKNGGSGDLAIDVRDSTIETGGSDANGVFAQHNGDGALSIGVTGGSITTTGGASDAIYGKRKSVTGSGRLDIATDGAAIVTERDQSNGIYGYFFAGDGDTGIDVRGGSIETKGNGSAGILGHHKAAGDIRIDVAGGASIETAGGNACAWWGCSDGADGILGRHESGLGTMAVTVGAGSSVRAAGTGASGVRFGWFNAVTIDNVTDGTLEDAAGVGPDGYRRQTATVNGTVRGGTGDAAGVYLSGGGKVFIGPQGTVGAASGVSVWARRKLDTEDAPALHVSLNPGGRRMAEVLDGGWILNDGGKTTIVMNGVKLHDGTAGATGLWAPNGAWDVTLREAGEVTDRDFSADDFIVSEHYAPRAAVYEALPGFLLRLDGGGVTAGALYGPGRMQASGSPAEVASSAGGASGAGGGKARAPGSPLWLRIGGSFGRYAARQADAEARYRFRRWEAEAGMDFRLAEGVTGYASARLASGSTRVAAPGGGGKASAAGYGLAAGAEWNGADGWFAAGRLSAMRYSLDLSSSARGTLAKGAGAWAFGYRAEAGRRMAAGAADVAGRVWLDGARMSFDGFTDAAATQVPAGAAGRLSAGAGLGAQTLRALSGGGGLALRGAFGAEFRLGRGTKTEVSGETLRSKGPGARLLLGLGAEWRPRKDDAGTALGFDAEASGAGSRDAAYSLNITLRTKF